MIEVVLSRPSSASLISWLIRKVIKFDASHASIHFMRSDAFGGQPMVFEAVGSGARVVHARQWDTHNVRVESFVLGKEHEEIGWVALERMWPMLGLPYDYPGVLSFLWRMLVHAIGGSAKVPSSPYAVFCSELVVRWLTNIRALSQMGPASKLADASSPADIATLVDEMSMFGGPTCEFSS